ncbi:MAG: DUF3482 domain-containing protein [Candidatus Sumerlaeia bacterium]
MEETPIFAVVGHVNKGKSSIVATLAEDDDVGISREARTTRVCREYSLTVDGKALFTLVDTPGFEQARHVLAWLRDQNPSADKRPEAVRRFVREYGPSGEYPEERELLKPILDGAGILYVVDGSRPFSPEYEAEMEILRWTGQPRMAMINRIGKRDHTEEWRNALDQYFSLVREFNAHEADFFIRLRLLQAFRELKEEWQPFLDQAISSMERERSRRRRESARIIANMLADQVQLVLDKKVPDNVSLDPYREKLEKEYRDELRKRERLERDAVEDLYHHRRVKRQESDIEFVTDDLFDEDTWLRLGLDRNQLAATGMIGGALIGGGVDAAAGGATFLTGALIGGAIGGVSGWLSKKSLSKIKIQGVRMGGKQLSIGPMKNPQFPWVALDRALLHHNIISHRPHARQDELEIATDSKRPGIAADLPASTRRSIDTCLNRLKKALDRETDEAQRIELARLLEPLCE